MADTTHPDVVDLLAERRELMRIAARTIVDNADRGRPTADADALQWARDFVRLNPPLGRPLGAGDTNPKEQHA